MSQINGTKYLNLRFHTNIGYKRNYLLPPAKNIVSGHDRNVDSVISPNPYQFSTAEFTGLRYFDRWPKVSTPY